MRTNVFSITFLEIGSSNGTGSRPHVRIMAGAAFSVIRRHQKRRLWGRRIQDVMRNLRGSQAKRCISVQLCGFAKCRIRLDLQLKARMLTIRDSCPLLVSECRREGSKSFLPLFATLHRVIRSQENCARVCPGRTRLKGA